MAPTERYENAFIVALIVRKVAAIFVDSLHVGHEYHKRVARARTPAPTSWLVVSKWDWQDNDHAKNRCSRKRLAQPIRSRCRRERLARAFKRVPLNFLPLISTDSSTRNSPTLRAAPAR